MTSLAQIRELPAWPEPDLSVLNGGRAEPARMPSALFGPAWGFLEVVAENVSTAPDYPAIALLASTASLIGGKRKVRPYPESNWCEPCILWCGVVGDPSARKSPALDAIINPLRDIEQASAEQHKADLRDYQERSEYSRASRKHWQDDVGKAVKEGLGRPAMPEDAIEPDEPQRRRTLTMDTTPEALATILQGNPQGVLSFRDELAGWLTGFDRYSPGGREFWLEAFGGRSFTVDRKGAVGPIVIPFNGVSVLGGIQPAKLADALLRSVDDGLAARFLWAWPEKVPSVQRPRSLAPVEHLQSAFAKIEMLDWRVAEDGSKVAQVLNLSEAAADIFEAWQAENAGIDQDASALFKSFVGKMDGAVLRLALVSEYLRWAWDGGAEPDAISAEALASAAEWVDDYAKPTALRVYGDVALPEVERNTAMLLRYIRKQGLRTVNLRDLKRSPHKSHLGPMRSGRTLQEAADYACETGWLRDAASRAGGTVGRVSADYAVNPALFEGAAGGVA